MAADEDIELRDLLLETLEKRGVINKIKVSRFPRIPALQLAPQDVALKTSERKKAESDGRCERRRFNS